VEKEKEEVLKIIVVIEHNEGAILVKNFDDMLHLLDEGWEVKEEYTGDIFIMIKKTKEPEDPS